MNGQQHPGIFVISLDFELYWGVRPERSLSEYRARLLEVRNAIPRLLTLFQSYAIHATWATVGFLFFETKAQLLEALPLLRPNYARSELSPYSDLKSIGENETTDPFHFGLSLIEQIKDTPHQEIATHTFSHYYCLEPGQDQRSFAADLDAAVAAARRVGVTLRSLVFPRNQVNEAYLPVCRDKGILAYRGTELSWIYQARNGEQESKARRLLRFLDSHVNLSGHNAHDLSAAAREPPYNIPSSRFLRPCTGRLAALERLRLKRNLADMSYAARTGRIYHLWWHPHNFGAQLEANLDFLKRMLDHYAGLQERGAMKTMTMAEIAACLEAKRVACPCPG